MRKIHKVLVANRGEIALRVIRACREMGIETVAVYSVADKNSQHVRIADESVCIGPALVSESYLNVQNIIAAAEITGADALHPGYGFLSENADFVEVLKECQIHFIGPDSSVIARMGHKSHARDLMKKHGVPVVPGSDGCIKDKNEALKVARECGFPVMVKAAAGGGGKGLRIVKKEEDFLELFSLASSEAQLAFGNGDCYVEKFVEEPRHIEVQILADTHGNVIHLGERNCSVQRRHQKLIEEAPSPSLSAALRQKICEAGVMAAKAVGYTNAGTVEFLVDKNENFYFMEMNTRLQVEHPVTEMITGIDIVREQIRIAMGEPLSVTQDQVCFHGHSFEFRINAENPDDNFAPCPGKIEKLFFPGGKGVRVDSMMSGSDDILPFYDSMIGKLIIHGKDRQDAVNVAKRALHEFYIEGISSTVPLHRKILLADEFLSGYFTTGFLERYLSEEKKR